MKDLGVLDSTWGGTLADMVRFVQEMDIVRSERLIEQVPEKSALLVDTLESLTQRFPKVLYNVRGYGLYQGFSLRDPAMKGKMVHLALEEEKLLLLGAGDDTIRLRPHLHVTSADIVKLGEHLERLVKRIA